MAELQLDRNIIILAVAVVVIVIAAILLFNNKYRTQEERDANRHKLYMGMALAILVAGAVYVLSSWSSLQSDAMDSAESNGVREEHGVFDSAAENLRNYRDRWAAGRAAKAAGAGPEEQKVARDKIKELQRQQKAAGNVAKAEAAKKNQAARDALLNRPPIAKKP